MKTYLDCLPCMMYQALKTGRIATSDEVKLKRILDAVGEEIKNVPMDQTPAQTGEIIYRIVKDITGVVDPYKQIKEKNITEAIELSPVLNKYLSESTDKLLTAIRIAIAGNIIDFGVSKKFNLQKDLNTIISQDFSLFEYEAFKTSLAKAKRVLYLGDNAGESVFDKILIEHLGVPVTYVVRGIPIINDVTYEDAVASGIHEVANIISSGTTAPGTILELCTDEFVDIFNNADMVISKGQGNYEALASVNREVFFLLKAKCHVVAKNIGVKEDDIVLAKTDASNS